MKTKEETIDFIQDQGVTEPRSNIKLFCIVAREKRTGKTAVHYGKVELSDLIGFIYGEDDESKQE